MLEQPKNKTLIDSLNGWPEGTKGHAMESELIIKMSELCKKHGYGRVKQVAEGIWDIWNHPETAETYKGLRETRLKLLEEARNASGD